MADFGAFVFSVFDYWIELAGGCAILVVLALIEKYALKREVSIKVYTLILAALVFWACFQAWKEQYEMNKKSPDYQIQISEKDTKIRELKDLQIAATAELNTLREAKGILERQLNDKIAENQSLSDSIKLAQVSVLNPIISLLNPHIYEDKAGSWLVLPLQNVGHAAATITVVETTVFIGGKEFSYDKRTEPILLLPSTPPFEFHMKVPNGIERDVHRGITTLRAVLLFKYKDLLGKESSGCATFTNPDPHRETHGQPADCKEKRKSA